MQIERNMAYDDVTRQKKVSTLTAFLSFHSFLPSLILYFPLTYTVSSHLIFSSPISHVFLLSSIFMLFSLLPFPSTYFLPSCLPQHFSPIILTSHTLSTPPPFRSPSLSSLILHRFFTSTSLCCSCLPPGKCCMVRRCIWCSAKWFWTSTQAPHLGSPLSRGHR